MPRLIDADELFKMVERSRNVNTHEKEEFRRAHDYEHSHFLHLITEQPTIDAVPVVRCRECRYNPKDGAFIGCPFEYRVHCLPDMYCGFGERREDDGDG